MNWIGIGLGAVSGVLAAGVATLLFRAPKEKKWAYGAVFAAACAVIHTLSREFVYPGLNAWYRTRQAEAAFLQIPAFQAIKQYDPTTYQAMLADVKQGLRTSVDESQLIGQVRSRLGSLIEKRLPFASNEAAAAYIRVIVTETAELKGHGGDLCFRFLFPQGSVPVDGRKYFSKRTQDADMAALAQVVKTSAESPSPIPEEAEVMHHLQPVYDALAKEFGEDIQMFLNPLWPSTDRRKVCDMALFLYSRILQLPAAEQGKALRFMLSQS